MNNDLEMSDGDYVVLVQDVEGLPFRKAYRVEWWDMSLTACREIAHNYAEEHPGAHVIVAEATFEHDNHGRVEP